VLRRRFLVNGRDGARLAHAFDSVRGPRLPVTFDCGEPWYRRFAPTLVGGLRGGPATATRWMVYLGLAANALGSADWTLRSAG